MWSVQKFALIRTPNNCPFTVYFNGLVLKFDQSTVKKTLTHKTHFDLVYFRSYKYNSVTK